MFAMVARTGRTGRMETSGRHAVRVTHALLFLSAMILSPGVCDACGTGCCNGVSHAVADGSTAGTASSVAATHCCGSPTGPSCSVADAGDGDQNNGACRCLLERRSTTAGSAGCDACDCCGCCESGACVCKDCSCCCCKADCCADGSGCGSGCSR